MWSYGKMFSYLFFSLLCGNCDTSLADRGCIGIEPNSSMKSWLSFIRITPRRETKPLVGIRGWAVIAGGKEREVGGRDREGERGGGLRKGGRGREGGREGGREREEGEEMD